MQKAVLVTFFFNVIVISGTFTVPSSYSLVLVIFLFCSNKKTQFSQKKYINKISEN